MDRVRGTDLIIGIDKVVISDVVVSSLECRLTCELRLSWTGNETYQGVIRWVEFIQQLLGSTDHLPSLLLSVEAGYDEVPSDQLSDDSQQS